MSLYSMIEIKKMNIQDAPQRLEVDAIVNCANPTLMGSDSNVDGTIHAAVDCVNRERGYFKRKIIDQFEPALETREENVIRCSRGEAVITKGYGLCKYIIHAVGPESDENRCKPKNIYSSSCVAKLTDCYENIMELVFSHPDIQSIALPVISSGNYGIDFEYAFTIGLTTVYNALLEKEKELRELSDFIELKKIYFVVTDIGNHYQLADNILERYKPIFFKEHRVVSRGAIQSQKEYWKEICLYDSKKGYFAIATGVRRLLLIIRWFLGLWTYIKDLISKEDWVVRRQTVEVISVIKMGILLPVLWLAFTYGKLEWVNIILLCVIGYDLLDTITYLLSLMLFADIQRPSANVSRSLIMLAVNYIEVELDMACVFMLIRNIQRDFQSMSMVLEFLIGDKGAELSKCLNWANSGIKFFFLTIVLSYFSSHMRLRKFRTQ